MMRLIVGRLRTTGRRACYAMSAAIAVVLAANASRNVEAQVEPLVIYEGARVITGDGRTAIEDGSFIVRNGVFDQVAASSAVKPPPRARHVDLHGKTVMPLIIDVHGHIGYLKGATTDKANYSRDNVLDHLRRYIYYGVGAMQSLGTDRDNVELRIRDEQRAGTLNDPGLALLFTADRGLAAPTPGQVNGGAAFATDVVHEVLSPDDARQFVRTVAAKKPDLIKFWVDDRNHTKIKLTPELYRPIIDEAHKQGLRAVAHVYYLEDAKELVRSGVDGLAHIVRDVPEDDELVRLIKQRNVFACTTMSVQRGDASTWLDDPSLAETVRPEVIKAWKTQAGPGAAASAASGAAGAGTGRAASQGGTYTNLEQSLRKLDQANARIVLCGDTGFSMQAPGFTEHRELKGMVDAGMSPLRAIQAATQVGAEVLGLKDRGTLARGKRADFMVLDANPLENMANSRRISAVYHNGIAVDRAALRAGWAAADEAVTKP